MPFRPPDHPLPRGVLWRHMTAEDPAGSSLAEWAYATPRYPTGLRTSDLPQRTPGERAEVMQFWFRSNYEPMPPGPWFSFDTPGAGWGQRKWAPLAWSSSEILSNEFGEVVPDAEIGATAAAFAAQASLWILITDRPLDLALLAQVPISLAAVQQSLERLDNALREFQQRAGGIGHNGGPPMIPSDTLEAVQQAVGDARAGLSHGSAGRQQVRSSASVMGGAAVLFGAWLTEKVAGKLFDAAWDRHAVEVFHALVEAANVLRGWLEALPSGPL